MSEATTRKTKKVRPAAGKVGSKVVIKRPTSVERTEKTFGVNSRRSRDIDALIEKATG